MSPTGRWRRARATATALLGAIIAVSALLTMTPVAARALPAEPQSAPTTALAAPSGNLVDNGSFESPVIDGAWTEFPADSSSIPDWGISNGPIDVVRAPHWAAPLGSQVVDLDGSTAGGGRITQSIPTTPGTAYELGLVYSGNYDCGDIGLVTADLYWDGALVGTIDHDTVANGAADHSIGSFDYQTFAIEVNGAGGGAQSTTLQIRSTTSGGTCGVVIDDVYVVHATPPVWHGSGPGTIAVPEDGTSGPPTFDYDYVAECCASGTWGFQTTATTSETVSLDWSWTGYHAWFMVTAELHAFVISADSSDTDITLVEAGPASCCSGPPSGGFSYAGTVELDIEPGDTYGFVLSGSNADSDGRLQGELVVGGAATVPSDAPSLIQAVATGGTGVYLIGRAESAPSTGITLAVTTAGTCTDGLLDGPTAISGGPVSVTTDPEGYFGVAATGVQPGDLVAVRVSAPATSDVSNCVASSGDNDYWPKALSMTGSTARDVIDSAGKSRWYKVSVTPGQQITVKLSGLPADYDLAVFKDIGKAFTEQLVPQTPDDLTKLSAEYAPSVFSPAVFSPAVFSPAVFSPDAYSPAVFSPAVFSPAVFSPAVFSPAVFSPAVFSPAVFSPAVFSPAVFSPAVFSPAVFSPAVFSPAVFSPELVAQAFSSAQTRSIIGVSATAGTGDETVVVNSWNNTGDYYIRVAGHQGAFDPNARFSVDVAKTTTACSGVTDNVLTARADKPASGVKTIILTDSSKLALGTTAPGTLRSKLTAFAARSEVGGVVIDVAADSRVAALKAQAAANTTCPYAQNLVAEEIKGIVDSYRANNAGLRYVVLAGGDDVIPFFRYPDQSLLGQESGYIPPVDSNSASEASLRRDFVLSQDAYGSGMQISLRTSDYPIPGLAVGRLVETPAEVAGMLDAYTAANGVVSPGSSLVTGYDFLADAADAVKVELEAGTGAPADTLITLNGKSPQDPASWTATQLSAKLLGSRHDAIFLAGHFSANSALAADFQTSLLTTDLAASTVDLQNAIVFSAGCHSGYNLVDSAAVTGVTQPLDWAQAFAQKRATLVAGTGYQYGDTDFLEYSERLYRDLARELRAGNGAIAIGEALVRAKVRYLATTPDIRGIHEKALLEATLFGLPMLGVNMPTGRGDTFGTGSPIATTAVPPINGTDMGLSTANLNLSPSLTPKSIDLVKAPYTDPSQKISARWLEGPNGVVTNPAEPALPLLAVNASSTNAAQVLRGVGFRSGSFTDTAGILPLTGAPTTELRGVHAPFVSPVFYPMKLWSPNYFGALGAAGGTNLLVTPVQHRSDSATLGTSVQRKYTGLGLKLFYSSNLTDAALSDAPTIVDVSAQRTGTDIAFSAQVIGDPAAAIHSVWVTWTGKTSTASGNGSWASIDLVQCVAPLPVACATTNDSRIWKGSLSGAPADLRYVVQAANGIGLVAFDDNRGSYFTPTGEGAPTERTATTLALVSPPSVGTFGNTPTITAELTSDGSPLAGKVVSISIGGAAAVGVTGTNGRVAIPVALNSVPGSTQIVASFAQEDAFAGSSDTAPFTIAKAPSAFSALAPFVVKTAATNSGIVSTLSATVGGKAQALMQQTVTVVLSGPVNRTVSTITDYLGQVVLPRDLPSGTYAISATFSGDRTYLGTTATGSLAVAPFTGFFSPVDNAPIVNTAKAGSTIPVKFSLGGNRGLAIFASGYPKATKGACTAGDPVAPVEETTTSANGLTYDPSSDQYKYNWKTPKDYAGSCYRLEVRFTDGTTFSASFRFK